jgi:hypothetical protein
MTAMNASPVIKNYYDSENFSGYAGAYADDIEEYLYVVLFFRCRLDK